MGSFVVGVGNFSAVPVEPALYRPGVIGGFAMSPASIVVAGTDALVIDIQNGNSVSLGGGCAVVGPTSGQWLYQYMPWTVGTRDDVTSGMPPGFPTPPTPPSNQQSWLWLTVSVSGGVPTFSFYWNTSATTPTNVGDALIGWVVSGVDPARGGQVLRAWSQNLVWAAFGAGKGTVTLLPAAPAPLPAGPGTGVTGGPLELVFNASLATLNQPYKGSLAATGGILPYAFAITAGSLPPGLSLDLTTGAITGTPTSIGTYTFTGQVTDSNSPPSVVTVAGTIFVSTSGTLSLVFSPATGIYNTSYNGQLSADGGVRPYTYAIASGALPPGLSLNSTTGWITGVPTAVGSYTFGGKVTDSTTPTASTLTISCTLVITAVGATQPVTEATLTSAAVVVEQDVNGNEMWQGVVQGTPPSDPSWGSSQAMFLPALVLASPIPSTSSGYGGGTIDVYFTPWGAPSVVTVASDGVTMTITAGPLFNPAVLQYGAWCIVYTGSGPANWGNQIVKYLSTSQAVLGTAITPGSYTFIPCECRFGSIIPGDTIFFDAFGPNGEAMVVASVSQSMAFGYNGGTGNWTCHWQLTRSPGAHASHSGVTQPETFGSPYTSFAFIVAGIDADEWAGNLEPGKTQAVSPYYQMGAPSAYMVLLVGQNLSGQLNPWPVTTTPHSATPVVAETQTTGNLQAARLAPTQISAIVQQQVGNPIEVLYDPGYELQGAGKSAAWIFGGSGYSSNQPVTGAGNYVHSGAYSWLMYCASSGDSAWNAQKFPCNQNETYTVSVWLTSAFMGNSSMIRVDFWNAAGGLVGSTIVYPGVTSGFPSVPTGPTWMQYKFTSTAPAGAVLAQVQTALNGAGFLWTDDWAVNLAPGTSGATGLSPTGAVIVNPQGISNAYIASAAVQAANMAAASVTAANAALAALAVSNAALQTGAVHSANILSVNAGSVAADSSVLGSLIAGTVTIALNLTVGGSIVSAQGSSYVGINAIGHALVASNTATGSTTVLDDGYAYTFASAMDGITSTLWQFEAYMGALTLTSSRPGFELLVEASYGSAYYQAALVATSAGVSLLLSDNAGDVAALEASNVYGTFLLLTPSSVTPSNIDGTIYVDAAGHHLWICQGGVFNKII
ncbi:MAG: putative Ig domain-containing protein [Patescibacteria group bacterium]|nr:putative Ig domain-containing protein [Patescibacteria group bacterium]